jgi:hypothetical protein
MGFWTVLRCVDVYKYSTRRNYRQKFPTKHPHIFPLIPAILNDPQVQTNPLARKRL